MKNQTLKKAGLKVTVPRVKILELLTKNNQHMTTEEIYQQLFDEEGIGLATVYRVLAQFEEVGLVLKHNFETGKFCYEIDRGEHHDHMCCTETGKVTEFCNAEIEKLQHQLAKQHGYHVVSHVHVLYVKPIKKDEK